MKTIIVDRKYLVGGKWFRFRKSTTSLKKTVFIIAVGRYELRIYK